MFAFFTPADATKAILDRYLDADFYVAAAGADAPTSAAVKKVGRKLGCKFPGEFVAHSVGDFGGAYVEVKEELWPKPKEYEVGPFWSFLYGFWVYSFVPSAPDWMNIQLAAAKFRDETGHAYVPCLKVAGNANIFAFTPEGRIVQWDHEKDEFTRFAGGFFNLFEHQVKALRERKDRKLAAT